MWCVVHVVRRCACHRLVRRISCTWPALGKLIALSACSLIHDRCSCPVAFVILCMRRMFLQRWTCCSVLVFSCDCGCVCVLVLLSIGVLAQLVSLVFSTRLWHRTRRVLVFTVIHPCGIPYVLRGPALHAKLHSLSCPLVLAWHCVRVFLFPCSSLFLSLCVCAPLHEARVKCNSTGIALASYSLVSVSKCPPVFLCIVVLVISSYRPS